jgi:hypothetical protein
MPPWPFAGIETKKFCYSVYHRWQDVTEKEEHDFQRGPVA